MKSFTIVCILALMVHFGSSSRINFRMMEGVKNTLTRPQNTQSQENLFGTGCQCNDTICDCCASLPKPISGDLCANAIWSASQQTITMDVTAFGKAIGSLNFSQKSPSDCLNYQVFEVCLNSQNMTIDSTGACGCWSASVSTFGVNVDVQIGCFVFGEAPKTCPN